MFDDFDTQVQSDECLGSEYEAWLAAEEARTEDYDAGEEYDPFLTDAEADADVLASAGWGTDEDYGDYGMDYDFDMYSEW